MHDDEVSTSASLVRRLLAAQFPQWADLPIDPVHAASTDNAMYRLGEDLAVRLPRRPSAIRPIEKEHTWLPKLAPHLPILAPLPLAKGAPGEGYPWPWSVCRWVDGENPKTLYLADADQFAIDLASFIHRLQAIDATDAPRPGQHNHGRGAPLSLWSPTIEERLHWLADLDDIAPITAAWKTGLEAAPWEGAPVWIHGDLSGGNLIVRDGRLSGVIDWSCLAAGDPACELQVAWNFFDREGRQTFRMAIGVDDATWTRGRAWGLAMGVLNFSYYRKRSPVLAKQGRNTINAVLADHARDKNLG